MNMVCLDMDKLLYSEYRSGVQVSWNGATEIPFTLSGGSVLIAGGRRTSASVPEFNYNFGQRAFANTLYQQDTKHYAPRT